MKKLFTASLTLLIVIMLSASLALAGDKVINQELADNPYIGIGKDGNEYVRLMITEKRTLNGLEYPAQVPVMAFRENVATAKTLKKGDTLKAIVQVRQYQGDASYSVRQFLN